MKELNKKPILFYDGVCILCNRSVSTVIKWDKKEIFTFATLSSSTFTEIAAKYLTETPPDSVILYYDERLYFKSKAVFKTLEILGFRTISKLAGALPSGFTDAVYDFVARFRYSVFGKYESCPIPPKHLRKRFLD